MVESAAASYREVAARAGTGTGAGAAAWERHCWLAVGRGTLHQDLYVAPDSLSDAEWESLSGALSWARENQHLLAVQPDGAGRPGRRGGLRLRRPPGPAATACLRNPADRPQEIAPDWHALLGLPAGAPLNLDVRYGPPGAGRGAVTLGPFEVRVLEARVGS